MKRIVSFLTMMIISVSLLLNLASCDRSYDEEVVKAAACELIEASGTLNKIYWGEGIPYLKTSASVYCEANFIALGEYGFYTIEELKDMTRKVFSEEYCEYIFSTSFYSVSDSDEIQFYARYYQKYADAEQTEPECIMVYSEFENMLPDTVEYLYDTLEVTHSKRDTVYVKITAKVTRDAENVQYREKVIGFVEEENGWRIDTSTYLKFNDKQQEYEDLLDKK